MTNYRTAEQLQFHNRRKLVSGDKIRPRWLDGGDRFSYSVDSPAGRQFFLVDPAAGTRKPTVDPDAGADAHQARSPLEVLSPDGKFVAFRKGHDIWVRSIQEDRDWALTSDGEIDNEYGIAPDSMKPVTLLQKIGLPELPPALSWSPDSTRVLTHRTDQRGVRTTHLIDSMPADGSEPKLMTKRYAFPGDDQLPHAELVVLDVAAGTVVRAKAEPLAMPIFSPISMNWAWWAEDGSAVYYLRQSRDQHTLRLHRLDPHTGESEMVLTETGETRVEPNQVMGGRPIVKVLPGGEELLWYSQCDGWGHLYLYDASGAFRGQVTSGEWAVQEILHVDTQHRVVYFVASGLVAQDPYRRTVCRIGLDGSGFAKVTEDDLDHVVTLPENKKYFIDSASTTSTPPVITVRAWDGHVIVELERTDVTRLAETGWSPPERFRTKAADGETDIYGVLYLPHGFDPTHSYPVLDQPYPGPQVNRVSPAFASDWFACHAESLAALGFVVVAVDGRGTPGRSKAFHDASFGQLANAGHLDDHVAALRELAETRPWMDLDRVGAFGYSGGGFATVRALCDYPDVYKVGVSLCGNHDNRYYHMGWVEQYDGLADEETYARASNVESADKMTGKLLLIHGGMDDNVSPHLTLRLVDRLIEADKDFDMLIVPGADHMFLGYEHHVLRRKWDYLLKNLAGIEPPADYRLTKVSIDMEVIALFFE